MVGGEVREKVKKRIVGGEAKKRGRKRRNKGRREEEKVGDEMRK